MEKVKSIKYLNPRMNKVIELFIGDMVTTKNGEPFNKITEIKEDVNNLIENSLRLDNGDVIHINDVMFYQETGNRGLVDWSKAWEKHIYLKPCKGNLGFGEWRASAPFQNYSLMGMCLLFEDGYAVISGGGSASSRDLQSSAIVKFTDHEIILIAYDSEIF